MTVATQTPTALKVPIALSTGKIDAGWISFALVDNVTSIVDEGDSTKSVNFSVGAQATASQLTLNVGVQTASRIFAFPVVAGNETLMVLGTAQTVTGALTITNTTTFSGAPNFTATGNTFTLVGVAASPCYFRVDQTANSGKIWRVGNVGASTFTAFEIFNQTDSIAHFTLDTDGLTLAKNITVAGAGAASAPPGKWTGAWFTGGTATTTKPQLLIEPTGTTSTGWNVAGTGLGVNAASGFVGLLMDLQLNGVSKFSVSSSGGAIISNAALDGDITGAFGNPRLAVVGDNSVADAHINVATGANASGAHFFSVKTRSTGSDANTIVVNGDQVARFAGFAADGASYRPCAAIDIYVDGTPGASDMPGRICFWTTPDGSATLTERLRIDNAGNVALGTAVLATGATDGFLYIPSCAGTPTGVPTAFSGRIPIIYDSTNNFLYVYNGGWKKSTVYA